MYLSYLENGMGACVPPGWRVACACVSCREGGM